MFQSMFLHRLLRPVGLEPAVSDPRRTARLSGAASGGVSDSISHESNSAGDH